MQTGTAEKAQLADVDAVVAALDRNAQRGVSEAAASLNEYLTAHSKRGSS